MEDNYKEDKFEEYLRKSIERYDDSPSDDVWEGIEAGLPASAPGGIFRFKPWMAAAAAIAFLVLAGVQYCVYQKENKELHTLIDEQRDAIRELEAIHQNDQPESENIKDITFLEKEDPQAPAESIEGNNSIESTADNAEEANIFDNNFLKPVREETDPPGEEIKNKLPDASPEGRKSSLEKGELALDEQMQIEPTDKSIEKDRLQEDFVQSEQEPPPSGKDTNASSGDILDSEKGIAQLNTEKIKPEEKIENKLLSGDKETLGLAWNKLPALEVSVFLADYPKPNIPIEIIPGKMKSNSPDKNWEVGLEQATVFSKRRIKTLRPNPQKQGFKNEKEDASTSIRLGLRVEKYLTGNWSLETGLKYSEARHIAMHRADLRFDHGIGPQSGNDRRYKYDLATSYGYIDMDVALTRADNSQDPIPPNEPIRLEVKTKRTLKYVHWPLMINYDLGKKPFSVQLSTGVITNFLAGNKFEITKVTSKNPKFKKLESQTPQRIEDKSLRSASLDYALGLNVGYEFAHNWKVALKSVYLASLVDQNKEPFIEANSKGLAVNASVSYRF